MQILLQTVFRFLLAQDGFAKEIHIHAHAFTGAVGKVTHEQVFLAGQNDVGRFLLHVFFDQRQRDAGQIAAESLEALHQRAVHGAEKTRHALHIERVIETHIHADFLSGHLELANATGAVICYGDGADVEYPIEALRDGQRLSLGEVTLHIVATPGHTPESICIAIHEHPADEVPYGVLTGDTLFVGDVGRPDLVSAPGQSPDANGNGPG